MFFITSIWILSRGGSLDFDFKILRIIEYNHEKFIETRSWEWELKRKKKILRNFLTFSKSNDSLFVGKRSYPFSKDRQHTSRKCSHTSFYCTLQILCGFFVCVLVCSVLGFFCLFVFNKLKVCSNPVWSKSAVSFFQQHLLTSCLCFTFWQFSYFQLFHYYICYGDLWSIIFAVTHWRLRWWLAFLINKIFLIKACTWFC